LYNSQKLYKKDIYEFAEEHLGQQLTKSDMAEIDRWQRASAKHDAPKQQPVLTPNFFFRYGMTAIVSIILCLSIVLPITLGNRPDNSGKQDTADFYRSNHAEWMETTYKAMTNVGLLLFADGVEMLEADYYIEHAKQDLKIISYGVNGFVELDDQLFVVDYRIRTTELYLFAGYFTNFFATLRNAHDQHSASISEQGVLGEIQNFATVDTPEYSVGNESIFVQYFTKNGIPVFFYNYTSINFAYIYFVFDGFEYCITIDNDQFHDKTLTAEYIMNEFIGTLFNNPLVAG
jgi:hypothetical protein